MTAEEIDFFPDPKINRALNELHKRFGDGFLDDLVHDVMSEQASAINNGGLECQIEFLAQNLGDKGFRDEILDMHSGQSKQDP